MAGVNGGGAVETGGSSAEGAASVRATGYDDGSGRMARVRAAAAAIVSATDPDAGAVQQQPAAELGAELYQQYCFRAGTPLKTPTGRKFVEYLQAGDLLLAAADGREDGPVEAKRVEEVFQGFAHVVNLHVRGRVIGTTPNHRFWVKGLGWVPCAELRPGDLLRSDDGQWVAVECVTDSGEQVPVYNVRVADHKTYFVGCLEWGFSVWSHNKYTWLSGLKVTEELANELATTGHTLSEADRTTIIQGIRNEGKYGARGDQDVLVQHLAGTLRNGGNAGDALQGYLGRSGVRRSLFAGERKVDAGDNRSAQIPGVGTKRGFLAVIFKDLNDKDARGKSFQDYLTEVNGLMPKNLPHGHHIVYKDGQAGITRDASQEGRDILLYFGLDPFFGRENLGYAGNPGSHSGTEQAAFVAQLRAEFEGQRRKSEIIELVKQEANRWVAKYH